MKIVITPRRHNLFTLLVSLLSILFMTAGCSEPDIPSSLASTGDASKVAGGWNAYSGSSSQIVWTDINGSKQYAAVPADGILLSSVLTSNKRDIRSVDTIPSGITSIGEEAFSNCTGLKGIAIPNSVRSIGAYAFSSCRGLTSILLPNSVASIAEGAFSGCTSLDNVKVEAVTPPTALYAYASWDAFDNTHPALCIVVPSASVAAYKAARGWSEYADKICEGKIVWTDIRGTRHYATAPQDGILLSSVLTSNKRDIQSVDTISISITSIGVEAFSNCTGLRSITLPSSVRRIEEYAFSGCRGLTSVTLPNSVTSVGESAFSNCTRLIHVRVDAVTPPTALYTSVWGAFEHTTDALSITVPDASIDRYKAADGWKEYAARIYVSRIVWTDINGTKRYANAPQDGVLYSSVLTSNKAEIRSVDEIPGSVTSIGDNGFSYCGRLASIKLPNSVTHIRKSAFYYCKALTNIIIPSSVTSIEAQAFLDCTSLASVTIQEGVTSIGEYTFQGCNSLTSITLPSSVTRIAGNTFYNCTSLRSVTIPNGVTIIGESAFYGCENLTNATLPNSVTRIEEYAFWGCSSLTSVAIPSNVTRIDDAAFAFCSGLRSLTIPNGVTHMGDGVFGDCSGLTSVTIPSSVTSIGEGAFSDCTGLTSVRVEATRPPSAGKEMFDNTHSSLRITVPRASVDAYKGTWGWSTYAARISGY